MPLRQIVIYGGIGKPLHIYKDRLQLSGLELQFEVIVLNQIPKAVFLESDIPEEVVLAILCDYGEDRPESVVRQILQHLKKILRRSDRIRKYQKQLLILSHIKSEFGFFIRAANGQNSLQLRCENTHVALLHSVFRASLV